LFSHTGVMKVFFAPGSDYLSITAANSEGTTFTTDKALPINQWVYIRAICNPDTFDLTVLNLDGKIISSASTVQAKRSKDMENDLIRMVFSSL